MASVTDNSCRSLALSFPPCWLYPHRARWRQLDWRSNTWQYPETEKISPPNVFLRAIKPFPETYQHASSPILLARMLSFVSMPKFALKIRPCGSSGQDGCIGK